MSIEVNCPSCGAKLKLPEKFARRGLVCTRCRHEFRLSDVADARPASIQPTLSPSQPAPPPLVPTTPAATTRAAVNPGSAQPTRTRPAPVPPVSARVPSRVVAAATTPRHPLANRPSPPAGAPRPARPAPIATDRRPKPDEWEAVADDVWEQLDEPDLETAALPPRREVSKPSQGRKRRGSKRRSDGSDWPFYLFGTVCFGPLLVLILVMWTWSALARVSAAADKTAAQAAQNANVNQPPAGAIPAQPAAEPILVHGALPPPGPAQNAADPNANVAAGNAAPAARAAMPRKIAPAGAPPAAAAQAPPQFNPPAIPQAPQIPNAARRRAAGGRLSEMRRQQDERWRVMQEELDRARRQAAADWDARHKGQPGVGTNPFAPNNAGGAAPGNAGNGADANPAGGIGGPGNFGQGNIGQGNVAQLQPGAGNFGQLNPQFGQANAQPADQAAGSAGRTRPSVLDPYLSKQQQGILGIVAAFWNLAMIIYLFSGVAATFGKAGRPRWGAIVPIYNIVLLFSIAEVSLWWALLLFVPLLNLLVIALVALGVAEKFGKGGLFAMGLAFLGPIFYPVLGFGHARYQRSQTRFASDSY